MVNLFINGQSIRQEENTLFGDFIHALNKELASKEQVVASIRVNGRILDEKMENSFQMQSLGHIGKIEIATDDPVQLAFSALSIAADYIRKIIIHTKKTSKLFSEQSENAEKNFLELVDSLDNLTQLVLSAQGVLRTKYKTIYGNDPALRIAQVRLISAIEELLPAKKNNDLPLLADILDNELPDALKEFRDHGLPVLQRLRKT